MECYRCAACCRVFGVVEVLPDDPVPVEMTIPTELGYSRMRTHRFSCIALEGNVCDIYDRRPAVCRRFEPGSMLCRLARWRLGLEGWSDDLA